MVKRKFQMYNIRIEYPNGSFNLVEYNDDYKRVNKACYKSMMQEYKRIKEKHINKECVIKFIGISDDGESELFSKINVPTEVTKDSNLSEDIDVLIDNIETILKKGEATKKSKDNYNTIIRHILHSDIEFAVGVDDDFKIETYNKLQELTIRRRKIHDDMVIFEAREENFKAIKKELNVIKNRKVQRDAYVKEMLDDFKETGEISCGGGTYVYPYKDNKERIKLMSDVQSKYKSVVNDEVNKYLICRRLK